MNTFKSKSKLLATITIMLLFASSMLAVVPQAKAIQTMNLSAITGTVGDVVNVSGQVEFTGSTVTLYWGAIGGTILNSTQLTTTSLDYSLDFTVPECANGTYTVFATEGLATGGSSSALSASTDFRVGPMITLLPPRGVINDNIRIIGTGFTGAQSGNQNRVTLQFYDSTGTTLLATTAAATSPVVSFTTSPSTITTNTLGSFGVSSTVTFKVPNLPDGTYEVRATDAATGGPNEAWATFVIGPRLEIYPTSGPSGTLLNIKGAGFTPGALITSVTIGAATIDLTTLGYVNTPIEVDADGKFEITPYVVVPGPYADTTVVSAATAKDIVISITETGAGSRNGIGNFRLTNNPIVKVEPVVGVAGVTDITITGTYFAKIAGTEVTLKLVPYAPSATDPDSYAIDKATLNANGEFTYNGKIPVGIPAGGYWLEAVDSYGLVARTPFGVAAATMNAPASAVSGEVITVYGYNFGVFNSLGALFGNYPANPQGVPIIANVTIGGVTVLTGLTAAELASGVQCVVPTFAARGYQTVNIVSNIPGLSAEQQLNVLEVTNLDVTPATTLRDTEITITGTYFGRGRTVTVTICNAANNSIVNTTLTNAMITSGSFVTDAQGSFTVTWKVPLNYNLAAYTVIATDNTRTSSGIPHSVTPNLTAKHALTIAEFDIDIHTDATNYYQNGWVNFVLISRTQGEGKIAIYKPNGQLYDMISLYMGRWNLNTASGLYEYVEGNYNNMAGKPQVELSEGAPLGNWTWTATFIDTGKTVTINGLFEVRESIENSGGNITIGGGNGGLGEQAVRDIVKDEVKGITKGDKGDKGDTGSSGSSGSSGATGPAGAKGADGAAGTAGKDGKDGINGEDKTSGLATSAAVIAIVALIIGAIAAFLAITLRRKIAN